MEKPESPRDYITWWNRYLEPKIDIYERKLYTDVSTIVNYDFTHSEEYKSLIQQLHNFESEYRLNTGFSLLMKNPENIDFETKDWGSFISKVWRKNVVQNKKWKYENWDSNTCQPDGGWITPHNWFQRIHDIVRTRIIVIFFDGVGFLLENMCNHFQERDCLIEPDWEAREEGYYAAHLNIYRDYTYPIGLTTQTQNISVEIQITTQMKDVISTLTHKYYERKRETLELPDTKWQWDYNSEEFSPNYLGHMLHYIEGAVMQIRDREQTNDKEY